VQIRGSAEWIEYNHSCLYRNTSGFSLVLIKTDKLICRQVAWAPASETRSPLYKMVKKHIKSDEKIKQSKRLARTANEDAKAA
jgi:hypothetical protein